MTPTDYDVAVIGYGPTRATAANLLGQLGLTVVVIERDPDVYGRARAISTDEEVIRIWQSVGLADRLQADMLPGRPVAFVDAHGVPFAETTITSRGHVPGPRYQAGRKASRPRRPWPPGWLRRRPRRTLRQRRRTP